MNDRAYLAQAIELSRHAPPSHDAYSVGAVIVDAGGAILSTGYSRELGQSYHAEQVAIDKARERDIDLSTSTLYTSMEPCSVRGSGLRPCTARILEVRIPRVVFAMEEPRVFVDGHGAEVLRDAGVDVVELSEDAPAARHVNAHISGVE